MLLSTPLLETAAGIIGPSDLVYGRAVLQCLPQVLVQCWQARFTVFAYTRCKIRLLLIIPTDITNSAGNGQDCTCFHWLGQYYKGVSSWRTGLLIDIYNSHVYNMAPKPGILF